MPDRPPARLSGVCCWFRSGGREPHAEGLYASGPLQVPGNPHWKGGQVGNKQDSGVAATIFELPTTLIERLHRYLRRI